MQIAPAPLLVNGELNLPLQEETIYSVIDYKTIDPSEFQEALSMSEDESAITALVMELKTKGTQSALAKVIIFPVIMLVCYLILIFYFRSKGEYRPIVLEQDETGR